MGNSNQLQDCFERTNWNIFGNQDLEDYTAAVQGYTKHHMDTVTADKSIRVYPNQVPWMTKEVVTPAHDQLPV